MVNQEENDHPRQAVDELSLFLDLTREIDATFNFQEIIRKIILKSFQADYADQGLISPFEKSNECYVRTFSRRSISSKEYQSSHLHEELLDWMYLKNPLSNLKEDQRFEGDRFLMVYRYILVFQLFPFPENRK